jgi:hypothetical protein
VYYVNNGDNYSKLFTLFAYFIHSRIRHRPTGAVAAHRLALEFEAIRVVDKAIQDRVGLCRIPCLKVPAVAIGANKSFGYLLHKAPAPRWYFSGTIDRWQPRCPGSGLG